MPFIKNFLKMILPESTYTLLKKFFNYIQSYIIKKTFHSSSYWENRYLSGGNSGAGSYGELATFKATTINTFIKNNNIHEMVEFGCGDGNQMALFNVDKYIGYDVSRKAVLLCKEKKLKGKYFYHLSEYKNEKYDFVVSLDVIYHLIEDSIYTDYMNRLFNASKKFVCIYASNHTQSTDAIHVRHRKFTDFISTHFSDWELYVFIENPYKKLGNTPSDFYFYRKHV